MWESNPPNPTKSGHSRFEDDGSHQATFAPPKAQAGFAKTAVKLLVHQGNEVLPTRDDGADHNAADDRSKVVLYPVGRDGDE